MKIFRCVILSGLACLSGTACHRQTPTSSIPDSTSNFQKIIYTDPVGGSSITLISDTECESNLNDHITVAEYSREGNRLRFVTRGGDVFYFDIIPGGMRELPTGQLFLLPEALTSYRAERTRKDQLLLQSLIQSAKQKSAEEKKQLDASNKALWQFTAWLNNYFTKGSRHKGVYGINPVHSFTFTPSADIRLTSNGLHIVSIDAVGTIDWDGASPNEAFPLHQENVHIKSTSLAPGSNNQFGGLAFVTWTNSEGNNYSLGSAKISNLGFSRHTGWDGFEFFAY